MNKQDKEIRELAEKFHETYERLAPEYGYETRPETKQFDPESPNGKLMIAVCGELLDTMDWVSVRERLPEEGKLVDVCVSTPHKYVRLTDCYLFDGYWHENKDDSPGAIMASKYITHWMEKPEPPHE